MQIEEMVKVQGVSKSYQKGKISAIDNASLQINKGEIFGIIGPDGAGKSSLFRIIATLLLADKGTVTIAGLDVQKSYQQIRQIIGYMPGKFSLYPDLSVAENLQFFADMYSSSIEENYTLIQAIYDQLAPFKDRRAGKLSGGMKQKLALCCALIHKPRLLILDEPTTGVDPVSRKEFWAMLQQLKTQHITILVATPYMDEATLCDRIAFMSEGKILQTNTPKQIIDAFPDQLLAATANNRSKLLEVLKSYPGRINSYAFGEYMHLVLHRTGSEDQAATVTKVTGWLKTKGLEQVEVKDTSPTIEDCFIQLLS
ncbi:MAG TPA: ABC transporter ATP-binding protein [Arachidicoccus sp.]|nr:ABC transporter ATP-binding protein [Arachidicoccus sp.]